MASDRQSVLEYPLEREPAIGSGESIEVAPGVHWLRLPMFDQLDSINVWAIADGEGWTIVDTGLWTPQTIEAWRCAFGTTLAGKPIRRVIVTHMHPDHSGMAGWLIGRGGAELWITRLEYLTLRVLASYSGREAPAEGIAFYQRAGWEEAAIDQYRARFGNFSKALYPIPDSFRRIRDGDRLRIGEHEWQVIVGSGHSPEHACLSCPALNLLISGDQILPRISSNVSVHPLEPEADPLSDWLASLADIRHRVAADTLVLPAHGAPFIGVHTRIDQLIAGHVRGLDQLVSALDEPKRATDTFTTLYRRPITPSLAIMATGEALAHLHCLRARGQVARTADATGVHWWLRTGGPA